jgi:hypothetical protein
MCDAAGLPCETVIASIREPSDFAGLPVVDAAGGVTLAPPSWALRLCEAGRGVLFLDELSTAPPAVQAALLRVVLERTVGDLPLPHEVTIVAAANPPEQAADGWDLSAPLANRFCHLDWTLDAREWADGLAAGFAQPVVESIEPAELAARLPAVRSRIAAFVVTRPHLLSAAPTDEVMAGRAWPSPRSWELAARLTAAGELQLASEQVVAALVAGAVGPGAAAEFLAWNRELDLPDPEAVLADPYSFRLPARGDRAYACLSSITAAVLAHNTVPRWEAAWLAIAAGTDETHTDIAIVAVRALARHRPEGALPPREVLANMAPVLRAAGLFDTFMAAPAPVR